MEVFECKYCKSKSLVLESRVSGEDVLTANMVALKCADCGKWIKWCPKEERHFYIKEKEPIFTFTQEQLDQHDAEVKKQVVEELREFLLKDLTLYTPHSFEYDNPDLRLFREREKVTNDLEQKLAELITPNKKGEKDE